MSFLQTLRSFLRRHPWQALAAVTLLQVAAACPELPGGSTTTVTAPSALTATAFSATQINLAWTDNSTNEDGFRIERAPGGTTTFAEIGTVLAGITTYQNTGLASATQYVYRVRAYNASATSDFSGTATATTLQTPPAVPSNLAATGASTSTINLTWTDNSNNEDGFRIERVPGLTGTFTEIATVGAGVVAYQNAGLAEATQFTYRVRAYNSAGNSGYTATATATTLQGGSPPAAPSGLGATTASSSQINLAWTDNSNNDDGFRIDRCSGVSCAVFAEITTVAAGVTSYQNTGLAASTSYTYRVRAFNGAGNSSYSATATAVTNAAAGTPPAAPTNLQTVTIDATQMSLTWTDNAGDEDGFKIERAPDGVTFAQIGTASVNAVVFNDQGLSASTTYTYRIRAYNAAGNSAYSNTAAGTTTPNPPSAPGALVLTPVSSSQINLSWSDLSSNETGFQVDRAPGGTTSWAMIAQVAAGATTYQNTGLSASTSYAYRVRAYNAGGYSGSIEATASTQAAGSVPAAPTSLLAAAASSAQINLTWTDNSNNEDGFRIEQCTGVSCSNFAEVGTVGAGVNVYPSTGLAEGTTYGFRVRAYNGSGNSGYSNTASVATETPIPTLPGNLAATAVSASQINLTWSDWSTNETGFKIERCTGAACSSWAQIATVGAGVTAYQNTGLSASTLYRYQVRAYNLGGNSAYSDPAEATTQAAPVVVTAPSGLTATAASDVQINLAWVDNSNNETGFVLEQAPGGTSNWSVLGSTLPAGTTSAQNGQLPNGTTYHYRVKAVNGGTSSNYSNTATATTWLVVLASHDNLLMQASVNGNETSERNTNYSSAEFSVGCNQPGGSSGQFCTMTALQFSGLQTLISGKSIAGAYLRVYPYQLAIQQSGNHAVNAFETAWNPATITWANEPNIYTDTQSELPAPTVYGAMDFNVTTIAQHWASGARTNAGLLVRDTQTWSLGTLRQTYYNGLDYNAGAQYRPLLIIIFQ